MFLHSYTEFLEESSVKFWWDKTVFGFKTKKLNTYNQAQISSLIVFLAFFCGLRSFSSSSETQSRGSIWPSQGIHCLNRRHLNSSAINYCKCFKSSRKYVKLENGNFLMQQHNLSLCISSKLNAGSESNSSCWACFPISTLGIVEMSHTIINWASLCFSSHWRFLLQTYKKNKKLRNDHLQHKV